MTKIYTIALTDSELDVIWDALTELENSSEPEVSEQASNVMDKLHESVVSKQQILDEPLTPTVVHV